MRTALVTLSLLAAYTLGTLTHVDASSNDMPRVVSALEKIAGELGRIRSAVEREHR